MLWKKKVTADTQAALTPPGIARKRKFIELVPDIFPKDVVDSLPHVV